MQATGRASQRLEGKPIPDPDAAKSTGLTAPCQVAAGLFPVPVVACCSVADAASGDVFPSEWQVVASANPRRQRDFLNGRVCARACLRVLGVPDQPLVVGERGLPIWPAGIGGSISHCDGLCVAIAARDTALRGIGIDAEARGRVRRDLEGLVLTAGERCAFAAQADLEPGDWLTVVFSAKEAFYKAQFPVTQAFLGFQEVSVALGDGSFSLTLERSLPGLGPAGSAFPGAFVLAERHILTGVVL